MADKEFEFDVFISYSHKDEEWVVNTLLLTLENAGLKVCIDYRDFDPGKPSIVNMEDSVDDSRQTVLVLTPNWTGSEWTDFEAVLTQTDDPVGRRQKMIPIMLEKCDPPKRVKSLTYVDFMRSDRLDNAWKQLFKALGKPDAPIPGSSTPTPAASRDTWHLPHPYPMPPNFTGRDAEQQTLDNWLAEDTNRLFILRALGGFGKSALTWQWINTHVNPAEWTKLVWWSFYEGDASFEHFIEETLKYLNIEVPQGGRPQVDALLKAMQSQKILLIMDGFERVLRLYANMNAAYQDESEQEIEDDQLVCKDVNAEHFLKIICSSTNIKSKILMTTRLTPHTIKDKHSGEILVGCHEVELSSIQSIDAIEFFDAQGIRGTHDEIEAACAPYGYHPLSLRILAGLISNDRESPSDIKVVKKIDITDDIVHNKNHVLNVSYNSLSFAQQKLLGNIACFRSSTTYQVLEIITNKPSWKRKNRSLLNEKLDYSLKTLESHGLLTWDRTANKYYLHPIVRRYSYARLEHIEDRRIAHGRLRDYFATVKATKKPSVLEDLSPTIELYYHTVMAGELDDAFNLYYNRLFEPLYYQFGAYQICIELLRELFNNSKENLPLLSREKEQDWVLNQIAGVYAQTGQPQLASQFIDESIRLEQLNKNYTELISRLVNRATAVQIPTGNLRDAYNDLRKSLELSSKYESKFDLAVSHIEIGRLQAYLSDWDNAEQDLALGLSVFEEINMLQGQSISWNYRTQWALLLVRSIDLTKGITPNLIIEYAQRSLELIDKHSESLPIERDYVSIHRLLGIAYGINNEFDLAESHLSQSLSRCRTINTVVEEADILLALARLRYDQKKTEEAKSLADEALLITERCGYVLQGADVNLFLAQYALEQEKDKVKAKEYAEEALKLATCDGPPYYYKVAYEEAEQFLEKLK